MLGKPGAIRTRPMVGVPPVGAMNVSGYGTTRPEGGGQASAVWKRLRTAAILDGGGNGRVEKYCAW